MTGIAEIMAGMIELSEGNVHDIDHFVRVWNYARTIGELEGLDEGTQRVLELAAIVHDIACPLCREKYGDTSGKHRETEGEPMAEAFLRAFDLDESEVERVSYLVGHHHTLTGIDGIDYQILIEADYIANATENGYSPENVRNFTERIVKTGTGRRLIRAIFGV